MEGGTEVRWALVTAVVMEVGPVEVREEAELAVVREEARGAVGGVVEMAEAMVAAVAKEVVTAVVATVRESHNIQCSHIRALLACVGSPMAEKHRRWHRNIPSCTDTVR